MDLLGRVAVIAIVAIIIIAGGQRAVFLLSRVDHSPLIYARTGCATSFSTIVKASNPNANITVINVSNSTAQAGSYNIVLSIVYNATKPCPTLFIDLFDYPAFGLSNYTGNLYTYAMQTDAPYTGFQFMSASYVIGSPKLAIARSYNQGIPLITTYVTTFGYNSVFVTSRFLSRTYDK